MAISTISISDIASINNFLETTFTNKIKINVNNTQSTNTLHHGKRILGNTLITPLPVTINRGEEGTVESKSIILKACGMVIYEIDNKRKGNLPLLLIIGWEVSIIEKNKWFVFVGCEADPNFPDERSINKHLKEYGNTGTNTLDFKEHSISMNIDGSISDG
ncbi:hypothetical protein RclHR1_13990001 [Rhizophagus clarus]|uniref:Uncharacterized protein n=1 Tax=Rhizophagus clarus TaxID=94130 RepID=A0A2Z6QRZ0_9GLOM|nr:hypothetical protein RclHR1_13990001 [Rhizophagus clarus]GET04128.1 hypothetical protein GLOIN_2v1787352 [Rhizophagus clarus]